MAVISELQWLMQQVALFLFNVHFPSLCIKTLVPAQRICKYLQSLLSIIIYVSCKFHVNSQFSLSLVSFPFNYYTLCHYTEFVFYHTDM